jgi:hypothetical protein
MNKLARVGVSTIACLALGALFCAVPSTAHKAAAVTQSATEAQTVSGKVTAISKTTFTLAVSSAKMASESQPENTNAKTMTFQVDSNTTIDGNLQVGVNADVTYRIDNGDYVALNVRVGQ